MANYEITLFSDTSISPDSISERSSITFQNIWTTRNEVNQTLFLTNSCLHGYSIQCAPPTNYFTATAEAPIYFAFIFLPLVLIVAVILLLVQNIRKKGVIINELQRQLSQRSEKYDTLDNDA